MQTLCAKLNARVDYTTQVRACNLNPNKYDCPPEVKPDILNLTKEHLFTANVQASTFLLHVFTHPTAVMKGIHEAFQIIQLLFPYSKCPHKQTWVVEILWTRGKKRMPMHKYTPLTRTNANTGYASKCGYIVVYRKEEWLKTLIHECFHCFNLDHGLGLSHAFGVPALLSEVFSEVWARIILSCLKSTPQEALRNLEKERNFSCAQAAKVLRHYGKTYTDVVRHNMQPYTEHTAIFAYYVLGAVALHMSAALVPFQTQGFEEFLLEAYKSPSFLRRMAGKQKSLALRATRAGTQSLRMTRRNLF